MSLALPETITPTATAVHLPEATSYRKFFSLLIHLGEFLRTIEVVLYVVLGLVYVRHLLGRGGELRRFAPHTTEGSSHTRQWVPDPACLPHRLK